MVVPAPLVRVIETCVNEAMLTGLAPFGAWLANPAVNLIALNLGR